MLDIYQLQPEGAVNNWFRAYLHMHFNVLLCQWYVYLWMQLFFKGCTCSLASLQVASLQVLVVTLQLVWTLLKLQILRLWNHSTLKRELPVWFSSLWAHWGFSLRLILGLAITVVDPFCNAERLRNAHKKYIYIFLYNSRHQVTCTWCPQDTS